jgi:hypothetical protein
MLANFWPPFLFSGIHIDHIDKNFRSIRVSLRDYILNRNYVGTAFGGSLSAMTDPFFMIMFINILGKEYYVWDKAGRIDFVAPGKGRLSVDFRVSDEQIAEIRDSALGGEKVLRDFHCSKSALCARIRRCGRNLNNDGEKECAAFFGHAFNPN